MPEDRRGVAMAGTREIEAPRNYAQAHTHKPARSHSHTHARMHTFTLNNPHTYSECERCGCGALLKERSADYYQNFKLPARPAVTWMVRRSRGHDLPGGTHINTRAHPHTHAPTHAPIRTHTLTHARTQSEGGRGAVVHVYVLIVFERD